MVTKKEPRFSKYMIKNIPLFTEQAGELVFIIIIFLAISYKNDVITFSQSLFGKLFIFGIVVYSFLLNPKLGLFISILLIFYYYYDLIHSYYLYEGYATNLPIVYTQSVENPIFDGSFNGFLNTPDNEKIYISTVIKGKLKEFNTRIDGDLILKIDTTNDLLSAYNNKITNINHVDTSFSSLNGFLTGKYYYNNQIVGDETGHLTGNVLGKMDSPNAMKFHINSIDSNIFIIKDFVKFPTLQNNTQNNDMTGCTLFISILIDGDFNLSSSKKPKIPLSAFKLKGFMGSIASYDTINKKNILASDDKQLLVLGLPSSNLSTFISSYDPNFDTTKPPITITGSIVNSNIMGILIPKGGTIANQKKYSGTLNADVTSTMIINNQNILMKITSGNITNLKEVKETFTTINTESFETGIPSKNNQQKKISEENIPEMNSLELPEDFLKGLIEMDEDDSNENDKPKKNPYSNGNVHTKGNTRSKNNTTVIHTPKHESFKDMETSEIKSAYPFTQNQTTIPSKFYTQYNYKLPEKIENKKSTSIFSDFFNQLLYSKPDTKENFTENTKIPYQHDYQNNQYSETQQQQQQPLSPQTKDDYQNNQFTLSHESDNFRKSYCVNNQLLYKNTPVRSEIAEHIFPNLQINGLAGSNGVKCNPCDPTCPISFSTIDQRLENENIIQKRNRTQTIETDPNWIPKYFDVFLPNPNLPEFNNQIGNSKSSYLIPANARIVPMNTPQ